MTAAGLAAVDLGHHLAHVHALGDAVAVAAMGAGDGVTVVEVAAHADGRSLLARVQVHEARDLAGRELRVHAFLELADSPHHPVGAQQLLPGQSFPLHRVGHVLLARGEIARHESGFRLRTSRFGGQESRTLRTDQ